MPNLSKVILPNSEECKIKDADAVHSIKINNQPQSFTPTNNVLTINADTSIGSSSTDNTIPTSKAVYDAILSGSGGSGGGVQKIKIGSSTPYLPDSSGVVALPAYPDEPTLTDVYNVSDTSQAATPQCVYNAFDLMLEGNAEIGNKFEYDIDRFRKINGDWTWDRNIAYKNGATITCNYDGTIRVETTSSATSEYRFYLEKYIIKSDSSGTGGTEDLWLRGCPPGGTSGGTSSTTGYWIEAIGSDNSSYYDSGGNGQNIYGHAEGTSFNISIRFKQTSLDKIFKPILVNWRGQYSTGTDYSKFIPNIPTVCDTVGAATELVDFGPKNNVWLDLNELKSLNTAGSWNSNTYTWLNVQFTFDDSDGTILVTSNGQPVGTPSGAQSKVVFVFKDRSGISLRGMMLSGCPANDLGITMEAQQVGGSYTTYAIDSGLGAEILSDASASTVRCYIAISPGVIVPELIFKPMICTKSQWNLSTAFVPCGKTNPELTKDLTDLSYIVDEKADKATTLNGYGITDAKINNGTITLGSNTLTPPTASVNSTTKAITINGTTISPITGINVNTTAASISNGTANITLPTASTSASGIVQLSSSTSSSSTAYAATSSAVRSVYNETSNRLRCEGYEGPIQSGSDLNYFLTPGVYISNNFSCSSSKPQPDYFIDNLPPDFVNFSDSVANFKFAVRLEVINPTTDSQSSTSNMMQRLYCFCTSDSSIEHHSFVNVYYRYNHYHSSSGYTWTRWNAATNNNAFGRIMTRGNVSMDFNTLYKAGKYWGSSFTSMLNGPSTGPTSGHPRWTMDVEEVMGSDGTSSGTNGKYYIKQTLYVVDTSNVLTTYYRIAECFATTSNQYGSVNSWYSWYKVSLTAG